MDSNSGEITTKPFIPFSNYSNDISNIFNKILYRDSSYTSTTLSGLSSFLNLYFSASTSTYCGIFSDRSVISLSTLVSLVSPSDDTFYGYKLSILSSNSLVSSICDVISALICYPKHCG